MMIGEILGHLELTQGLAGAVDKRWVQVRCGGTLVTALDPVGARAGELVVLTTGAQAGCFSPEVPVDAVIIGIVGNHG